MSLIQTLRGKSKKQNHPAGISPESTSGPQSSEVKTCCEGGVVSVDCANLCKDGLSAYELWVQNQLPDADTSKDAFFSSIGIIANENIKRAFSKHYIANLCGGVAALRGESAYEVWAKHQQPDSDTSLEAFFDFMRGKSAAQIASITVRTKVVESTDGM